MGTITTELIERKQDERGRKITSKEERRAMIAAFEQSGLTQKAFAQRERINYHTFVAWLQGARGESREGAKPKEMRFWEVGIKHERSPKGIEVQLVDGTVVRGGDLAQVAQMVRALKG